jgi:hypothetical protein
MKSIKIEDRTMRQAGEENGPKVGIFWLIPAEIIDEEDVLLYAEQTLFNASHVDMFYDATFEHYVIWDTIQMMFPELKNAEYEEFPRGRVTFTAKNYPQDGTFKLMADVKILRQKECLLKIKQIFNMKNHKIEVLRDAHYRT